jgi:hypothetical protein
MGLEIVEIVDCSGLKIIELGDLRAEDFMGLNVLWA